VITVVRTVDMLRANRITTDDGGRLDRQLASTAACRRPRRLRLWILTALML
jgi:hypothetical protein